MNVRDGVDQSADWATRIDSGLIDPETDEGLRRWLDGDPRRRGALLRAEAALSFLNRGRALSRVVPKPEVPRPWTRRMLTIGGLAAAASLAGILVLAPGSHRYGTGIGEIRQVPLSDGSIVEINTQSAVDVTMRPNLREVTLTRGEAWFHVSHDTQRPFIVSAGHIRIRAVGTAFAVRRRDDGADVQVTEGVVETWTTDDASRRVRVVAGSKAYVTGDSPPIPVADAREIERSLAWRTGHIVLEGETLAEAVAQFNRYNKRRLVIADAALADEKLVGQFRATDPASFAEAVTSTLGATVEEDGQSIRLSRPPRN